MDVAVVDVLNKILVLDQIVTETCQQNLCLMEICLDSLRQTFMDDNNLERLV